MVYDPETQGTAGISANLLADDGEEAMARIDKLWQLDQDMARLLSRPVTYQQRFANFLRDLRGDYGMRKIEQRMLQKSRSPEGRRAYTPVEAQLAIIWGRQAMGPHDNGPKAA